MLKSRRNVGFHLGVKFFTGSSLSISHELAIWVGWKKGGVDDMTSVKNPGEA